ncbi:MAG: hypothetical protein AMJ65_09665 [Phycisphaerae bacterium SG8_4]|nr:MAG: hypothetical protein AMJ65_09665 [Phycisphaerae bacterium SG8_4]
MYDVRKIAWRSGSSAKIPAKDAFDELERIRAENDGDLSASIVVEAARPRDAVLHPQVFDRGVKAAAKEYYLYRARLTMRDLVVIYLEDVPGSDEPKELEVRQYSTVAQKQGATGRIAQIYSSTEEALEDPARREYVLAEAIAAVAKWRKKYAALSELAIIFRAIDKISV